MKKMMKLRTTNMKEIMDQINTIYNKSNGMGSGIKVLVDEWIDAGDSLEVI